MTKYSLLTKISICFALIALLSACGGQRIYRKGMEAVAMGEYYKSTDKLRKAYQKIKSPETRTQIAYDLGIAYQNIGEYNRAAIWYKNAIRRNHPDTELNLLLAEALCATAKFKEAKEYYEAYLALNPTNNYAQTKLQYCDSISIWEKTPNRYEVEILRQINSRESDYAAFYSSIRGDEIILSSMREDEGVNKATSKITGQRLSQVYRSTYDLQRKRWNKPELLNDDGAINTETETGAAALSPDGKTLIFTRCETSTEENKGASLYQSNINRGSFAQSEKLELAPDSFIVAHPYFSATGDTLFFTSNLTGGYGGTDIWMAIKEGGKFGTPLNLGGSINTPGDETFPTTDPEGNLYFSSNALAGFGGFDIFKATKTEQNDWIVTHLPAPINSTGDDLSLTFMPNSEFPQGLFTSNRKGSKKDDIYSFKLPPVKFEVEGTVYNKDTQEPIDGARVRIISSQGTDLRIRTSDGDFKFKLKPESEYVFAAYKDEFLSDKFKVSTIGLADSKNFSAKLYLAPIDKPITVNNINYAFGSANLTEESKLALDTVINLLTSNPSITIEIMAHTDHVGTELANSNLSQDRAQSVVNYLISKGINSKRLVAKGYGETWPKQVSAEIAQQYSFLQKDNVLTENFINKLSSDQQEIAKSINRRTEIKVLSTDYQER